VNTTRNIPTRQPEPYSVDWPTVVINFIRIISRGDLSQCL